MNMIAVIEVQIFFQKYITSLYFHSRLEPQDNNITRDSFSLHLSFYEVVPDIHYFAHCLVHSYTAFSDQRRIGDTTESGMYQFYLLQCCRLLKD